jgi:hypothetical protein
MGPVEHRKNAESGLSDARIVGYILGWSVLLGVFASSSPADVTLSSLSGPIPFFVGTIADAGQSFTVPAAPNDYLLDFHFAITGATGPMVVNAQLYPFDPTTSEVTGSALFTNSDVSIPSALTLNNPLVEFAPTAPIALTPGGTYMLIVEQGGLGNSTNLNYAAYDDFVGGDVRQAVGSTPPYTDVEWFPFSDDPGASMGFTADFVTSVPEPASASLLTISSLFLLRRTRRQ